jgi:hypothetical protein
MPLENMAQPSYEEKEMTANNKVGLHATQFKTIEGLRIRFATNDKKSGDPILLLSPLPESILAFLPTWDMFAALNGLVASTDDLPASQQAPVSSTQLLRWARQYGHLRRTHLDRVSR